MSQVANRECASVSHSVDHSTIIVFKDFAVSKKTHIQLIWFPESLELYAIA